MKNIKIVVCLIGLITFFSVQAQQIIHLDYKYSEDLKSEISSQLSLASPNGVQYLMYADTLKKYNTSFPIELEIGTYSLEIQFKSTHYGIDSLSYPFVVNGKENDINITVGFYLEKGDYYFENNSWKAKKKYPQGMINISKFYDAPSGLKISYAPHIKATTYYKEPFFTLENHTTDTIYGEYLPGYFWGTLTPLDSESKKTRKWIGILDDNFAHEAPLYPDSSKIASVGSFGIFSVMPKLKYLFTLLCSTKEQSTGVSEYKTTDYCSWWAGTKEYYKIEYEFEVK